MLDWFAKNPLLTAITGASSLLASLAAFGQSLVLPPLWQDAFTSAALIVAIIFWMRHRSTPEHSGTLLDAHGTVIVSAQSVDNRLTSACAVGALLLLLAWSIYPLARFIVRPHWTLCGTVLNSTKRNFCITLLDARKRKIADDCFRPIDDSGYVEIAKPRPWAYRPALITLRYFDGKQDLSVPTGGELFVTSCNARLDLP
jgi:hypothetical protein